MPRETITGITQEDIVGPSIQQFTDLEKQEEKKVDIW
jgi:hypothetical protein